nr:hypothetical protein [Tanacetum cinerariifolium]
LAPMQMTPDLVRPTTNSFSKIRGLARASLKNIASHVLSSGGPGGDNTSSHTT